VAALRLARGLGWALGSASLLGLSGCVPGELFLAGGEEAGADARLDAPTDAREADRAREADTSRADGAMDDAGPDAMPDVAPGDVMPRGDSGPRDSGPADTGSLPPVFCGADAAACPVPSEVCCVSGGAPTSYGCAVALVGGNPCKETPVSCGGAADCPGGVCCAMLNLADTRIKGVSCQTSCTAAHTKVICNRASIPDECATLGLSCGPASLLPGFYQCGP
jgi:hypothetical protein